MFWWQTFVHVEFWPWKSQGAPNYDLPKIRENADLHKMYEDDHMVRTVTPCACCMKPKSKIDLRWCVHVQNLAATYSKGSWGCRNHVRYKSVVCWLLNAKTQKLLPLATSSKFGSPIALSIQFFLLELSCHKSFTAGTIHMHQMKDKNWFKALWSNCHTQLPSHALIRSCNIVISAELEVPKNTNLSFQKFTCKKNN